MLAEYIADLEGTKALTADAEIRRVALEDHAVGSVLRPWGSMKPSEED